MWCLPLCVEYHWIAGYTVIVCDHQFSKSHSWYIYTTARWFSRTEVNIGIWIAWCLPLCVRDYWIAWKKVKGYACTFSLDTVNQHCTYFFLRQGKWVLIFILCDAFFTEVRYIELPGNLALVLSLRWNGSFACGNWSEPLHPTVQLHVTIRGGKWGWLHICAHTNPL